MFYHAISAVKNSIVALLWEFLNLAIIRFLSIIEEVINSYLYEILDRDKNINSNLVTDAEQPKFFFVQYSDLVHHFQINKNNLNYIASNQNYASFIQSLRLTLNLDTKPCLQYASAPVSPKK